MSKVIQVVGGVFYRRHQQQYQVQLFRKTSGAIAGLFEFPGGKIEPGETAPQALVREIQEELAVEIVVEEFVGTNRFQAGDRIIELSLYLIRGKNNQPLNFQMQDHDQELWLTEGSGDLAKIAPGDLPLLAEIFAKIKTKI